MSRGDDPASGASPKDGLGDRLKAALARIGIDEAEVTRILGRPCGCDDRRRWLNSLDAWARRVLAGRVAAARLYLGRLLGGVFNDHD